MKHESWDNIDSYPVGVDVEAKQVLWWDADNGIHCVNNFTIAEDGSVEFSPMPEQSFEE